MQERPTGSRDPFALRRAALGVLQILLQNGIRLGTETTVMRSVKGFVEQWNYYGITEEESAVADTRLKEFNLAQLFADVSDFFADRLKVQQREAGVRHDLIDAVFALGGEDRKSTRLNSSH